MRDVFEGENDPPPPPTLSGSIVFADYQVALSDVYQVVHERLDRVAKEGMGRDALAVAVRKSGGTTAEWASHWAVAKEELAEIEDKELAEIEDDVTPVKDLLRFAVPPAPDADGGRTRLLASRLPYLIRERFSDVLALKNDGGKPAFDGRRLRQLLAKEIGDSGVAVPEDEKEGRAAMVARLLTPYERDANARTRQAERHVGAMTIARFLGAEGLWSYYRDWQAREHRP